MGVRLEFEAKRVIEIKDKFLRLPPLPLIVEMTTPTTFEARSGEVSVSYMESKPET